MNCHDVQSRLNDYLDAELDSSLRKEINDHLSTCSACQAELKSLRDFHLAVKNHSNIDLHLNPENFANSLKTRIQSEGLREHRPVTSYYGRIAVVILAFLLIILLMGAAQYFNFISGFKPYKTALANQDYIDEFYPPAAFKFSVFEQYQPLFSYPIRNQRASEWLSDLITSYSKGELSYDLLYPILDQSNILDNASIAYEFNRFSATQPRPAPVLLLRHRLPQRFILKFSRSILLKNWEKLNIGIRSNYRGFTDAPIISNIGLSTTNADEVYILFFVP